MSASSEIGGYSAELRGLIRLDAAGILAAEEVALRHSEVKRVRPAPPADPCRCRQAPGATRFEARANACGDKAAADDMLFDFDEYCLEPGKLSKLSPADLNNVACALVWQTEASTASAERALMLLEMADKNKPDEATAEIIAGNRRALLPISTEAPPIWNLHGASLYKPTDEATDALAKEGE